MPGNLLDQIVDKIRNIGTSIKLPIVTTMAVFFGWKFSQFLSCGGNFVACGGMQELGIIFPFYFLAMPLLPKLTSATFLALYVLSATFYTAVLYYAVGELEKYARRSKERPEFTLRRIQNTPG